VTRPHRQASVYRHPDFCIERTSSGRLRPLVAAAHVKPFRGNTTATHQGARMLKPIVNLADVEFQPRAAPVTGAAGARYEAAFARVGAPVGARRLGYTVTAVPPGKRAFPFHSHRVNEEILRSRGDR
jgi:hypothetical protein